MESKKEPDQPIANQVEFDQQVHMDRQNQTNPKTLLEEEMKIEKSLELLQKWYRRLLSQPLRRMSNMKVTLLKKVVLLSQIRMESLIRVLMNMKKMNYLIMMTAP